MVLNLDSPLRKAAVAMVAAAATLGLSIPLWSHFRAARFSANGTPENLERAIALQPRNAELHNRLGRALLYSPLGDSIRARAALQMAVELDPRNGAFWIDLAIARELEGDLGGAATAIARGLAAEPRTPAWLWHAANFEIRRGRIEDALDILRTLMQNAPEYTSRVLPLFSRVTEPKALVGEVVPPTNRAMGAALEFIRGGNHLSAAAVAWDRVLGMDDPPFEQARPFVNWLITVGEIDLARRVWLDSARRGWIAVPPDSAADPLYNADFRNPLQDFGFDWRVIPNREASVWLEGRGPEPGMNSLCVQFSEDARSMYSNVHHFIPVKPDHYYSLRAAMRSERMASHTGAYLQVREVFTGRSAVRTNAVTGTGPWREVVTSLQTGPEARVVLLELVRPAPAAAEEGAAGMVCISGLQWTELGPAKSATAPSEKR